MQTAAIETEAVKVLTALEISTYFLESAIGNTPLIRLRNITIDLSEKAEIYAKAEHLNPGGSVKDRAALSIILGAEASGKLTSGKTILDATSGNTGIAYAMIGAARGYSLTLTLPKNASAARKQILKLYGAEIIETDPLNGTDGAQIVARELAESIPTNIFTPINTTTTLTGKRILRRRRLRYGGRQTAASRISSQVSARREHLSARPGD